MKHRFKHSLTVSVMTLLTIVLIASGCSGSGGNGNGNGAASQGGTEAGQSAAGEAAPMKDGKYDPPIKITVAAAPQSGMQYLEGETRNNNDFTKWAKEKFGLEFTYEPDISEVEAFETKLRLMMTSGEKMPDIVTIRNQDLATQLIDSGLYQEVGPLFDKYANDAWKTAANFDQTSWYFGTRDGKRYAIPDADYANQGENILWVREDWRKELNLPEPKTIDDLETILEGFKTKNPSGQSDFVPLAVQAKNDINAAGFGGLDLIYAAYGAMPQNWNVAADGTLQYGSVQPEFKQALAKLADWKAKGYISGDIGLMDQTKVAEQFAAQKAGVILGAGWLPWYPFQDLVINNPEAEYKAYPSPLGPDGKSGHRRSSVSSNSLLISKDMKNPEAFFTLYNYMYEGVTVGGELQYGFFKGRDWDIVDGKPTRDWKKYRDIDPGTPSKFFPLINGARIPDTQINLRASIAKKKETGEEMTDLEASYYNDAPRPEDRETLFNAFYILDTENDTKYPIMFRGAYTETMKQKNELLKKMEMDMFNKIVYGKAPVDEFDRFVQEWKQAGGDQVTKEVNAWYTSVNAK